MPHQISNYSKGVIDTLQGQTGMWEECKIPLCIGTVGDLLLFVTEGPQAFVLAF